MPNFVYWKLPEFPEIYTIREPTEINLTEFTNRNEGFVLFPFSKAKDGKLFQGKIETIPSNKLVFPNITSKSVYQTSSAQDYHALVLKALEQIEVGIFKKVVLAQTASLQLNDKFILKDFFDNLCQTYPNAFIYCLALENEIWIGASPEVFLKKAKNSYQTYALAGTRHVDTNTQFGTKEQNEQAFVRDYIVQKITEVGSKSIQVSELHEVNTGNLWHLINIITFENQNPIEIIRTLHPTPAICGFPLHKSLEFINRNEPIDREYYAGYLGPISNTGDFSLWVNLRCAKISEPNIFFYAGAGIVAGSNPEAERLETERKMDTLRQLI